MLGHWEGNLGFPQAQEGPLGETEMEEQTGRRSSLSITHPGFLPARAVLLKTLRGSDCGHPEGPLCATVIGAE